MLGVVAAFAFAPHSSSEHVNQSPSVQNIQLSSAALSAEETIAQKYFREERIQRGDTLGSILTRLAIDDPEAIGQLRSAPEARAFYQLVPGRTIKAVTTEDGTLLRLRYLTAQGQEFHAERIAEDKILVEQRPLAISPRLMMSAGEIQSSLFQATDDAGLDDEIAVQLAEIFSGEIDFHRDLRSGDRFSVVYEAFYNGGDFIRTGRIVAAEFNNAGRTIRAVEFRDKEGRSNYYTNDGKSLRRTFLRSPLEFSRITSGFSSSRFHPILATWRAHRGVDYGAPQGTRVRATADGVVRTAGTVRGYGNIVVLRHPNGHETVYGHLSGFSRGMHAGQRVTQGDVIGFVGATGLATGPHLHYELRINGVHQNPLKVITSPAPGITVQNRQDFLQATQPLLNRLTLMHGMDVASIQ